MIRTIYSPPSFVARAVDTLPRVPQSSKNLSPSRIHNSTTLPRPLPRLANYREFTRDYTPRGPVSFNVRQAAATAVPAASAPSTAPASRKLCAFTGLPLHNGKLSIGRGFITRPMSAALRTASPVPATVTPHAPRMRLSLGVLAGVAVVGTAENAAQPAQSPPSVISHTASASQPAPNPTRTDGETVLNNIGRIRQMWQSGYFTARGNPAHTPRTALDSVHRIQQEIAQARMRGN
ncbi:hypothetical protein [Stenotrophomonas tumulicola]|uniref:Uncharacterized protein n=1 Tax=Stenotrophomonas tumulicola TaxID=1685415 RepID=A0A7W3FNN4_9GAMM|nr:hypothetical protein [Stenotrophomonas tumulicola]MBA8682785.1 hypothetical protein [Stenotrophomonas tumulicola]